MSTTRPWRLAILALSPFVVSTAWAQAPRGPYYHRTTTPGFVVPRGADRVIPPAPPEGDPMAPAAPGGWDRLRPYTAGGSAAAPGRLGSAYSTHRRAVPPPPRPAPPSARNYYPTARFGQGPNRNVPVQRDQCTPSRGGMVVGSW